MKILEEKEDKEEKNLDKNIPQEEIQNAQEINENYEKEKDNLNSIEDLKQNNPSKEEKKENEEFNIELKEYNMLDDEDGNFIFIYFLEYDEEFKNYILVDPAFVGEIYEGYEVIDNYFN